jgi:hypothetical protein
MKRNTDNCNIACGFLGVGVITVSLSVREEHEMNVHETEMQLTLYGRELRSGKFNDV